MKKNILLLLILTLFLTSCLFVTNERVPPDSDIIIRNNSNISLILDFRISNPKNTKLLDFERVIDIAKTKPPQFSIEQFEESVFNDSFIDMLCVNPDEKIIIYLFNLKTLSENPWEKIVADKLFLKRYELGLDDLQGNQWVIEYDGM